MDWVEAGLWGILGGFVVEGLDFITVARRHQCWPWQVKGKPGVHAGPALYAVVEVLRLVIGGVVCAATAASGQVSGALAALAIGVGTPLAVERLVALIPLPTGSAESPTTAVTPPPDQATGPRTADAEVKQTEGAPNNAP